MTDPARSSLQQDAAGRGAESTKERWESTFLPNYPTPSLRLVRGQGAHVWDHEGNEYLDLLAGIAVNVLGHAHPEVVAAVTHQVSRLGHVSNLYASDVGLDYAQRLSDVAGGRRVLLVNSGAEANEAAWKLVRRRANENDAGDGVVVAFEGSFHGRTVATLGLTGQPAHREGFDPLPGGVVHVPYNDPEALKAAFEEHRVVGVFAEYVQGEGGVVPMDKETAGTLKSLTDNDETVLVADEVQTGVARTGSFFAHELYGHDPDVVTMAKGLGGGMPLGAMLAKPALAQVLGPGSHGCTYGGNPMAVAAGNVVLDVVQREGLAKRAARLGSLLEDAFNKRLEDAGLACRGLGLLQGIPLPDDVAPMVLKAAQEQGLLVGQAGKRVVRLAPPLVIDEGELLEAVPKVSAAIENALA